MMGTDRMITEVQMYRRLAKLVGILCAVVLLVGVVLQAFEAQPEGWSSRIECADGEVVYDDELAAHIASLGRTSGFESLVVVFTQCNSGGMLDDLAETLEGQGAVALLSACSYDESAWGTDPAAGASCLRASGLKDPVSHYIEALARVLDDAHGNGASMAEVAERTAASDAAAPGGPATSPLHCDSEDRVTEPEHPQAGFLGGGEGIRLGLRLAGADLPVEQRAAVLFVGETDAPWARADLERFHGVIERYGFLPQNTFVLAGAPDAAEEENASGLAWPSYVDRPATREALLSALGDAFACAGPSGQVVFWSTGHGDQTRRIGWDRATALRFDDPIEAELDGDDLLLTDDSIYDVYRFEGRAGEEIALLMTSTELDAYLYLYADDRQVVGSDDDSGGAGDAFLRVSLERDGAYYVVASTFGAGEIGDYRLDLTRVASIRFDEALPVASGEVMGVLAAGDATLDDGSYYDLYAFVAPDIERLTVQLASGAFDAFLWLYDEDHNVVASSDDAHGSDAVLFFAPEAGRRYTIVASSFSPGATGSYALRLSFETELSWKDEELLEHEARGVLERSDGTWLNGSLFDLYAFSGTEGASMTVTLCSDAFDAVLHVLGPGFGEVAWDDDGGGGSDARATIELPEDGTYRVIATTYARGETGPYVLTLTSDDATGVSSVDWESSERIEVGATLRGRLAEGDALWQDGTHYDLVSFVGRAGDELDILLHSQAFDAYLYLFDADYKRIGSDDDSGGGSDALLHVVLPADGVYTVVVNSFYGDEVGAYELSILVAP